MTIIACSINADFCLWTVYYSHVIQILSFSVFANFLGDLFAVLLSGKLDKSYVVFFPDAMAAYSKIRRNTLQPSLSKLFHNFSSNIFLLTSQEKYTIFKHSPRESRAKAQVVNGSSFLQRSSENVSKKYQPKFVEERL